MVEIKSTVQPMFHSRPHIQRAFLDDQGHYLGINGIYIVNITYSWLWWVVDAMTWTVRGNTACLYDPARRFTSHRLHHKNRPSAGVALVNTNTHRSTPSCARKSEVAQSADSQPPDTVKCRVVHDESTTTVTVSPQQRLPDKQPLEYFMRNTYY